MQTFDLTIAGMTIEPHPLGFYKVRDATGSLLKKSDPDFRSLFWSEADAQEYIDFCQAEGRNTHDAVDQRDAWTMIFDAMVVL